MRSPGQMALRVPSLATVGLFRTVACEKMVHWAPPAFAELVWEHIGKYVRDPQTKN